VGVDTAGAATKFFQGSSPAGYIALPYPRVTGEVSWVAAGNSDADSGRTCMTGSTASLP